MKRMLRCAVVMLAFAVVHADSDAADAQEQPCFAATGQRVSDTFSAYWQQHGGQAVFGLPLNPAHSEVPGDSGQQITTQWFEQARLEAHAQNPAPYKVHELLQARRVDWRSLPRDTGPQPGCLWFAETKVNLCDQGNGLDFKRYWEHNGIADPRMNPYQHSLARFGMPLTPLMLDANDRSEHVRARLEEQHTSGGQTIVRVAPLGSELRSGSQDAWARTRRLLPASVAVFRPTFVPERFGLPLLQETQVSKEDGPRYTITYAAPDENLAFILNMGAGALGNGPMYDILVPMMFRGVSATLGISTESHVIGISWQENGQSYQITASSTRMTKAELLRIANSLVPVTYGLQIERIS